MAVRAIASLLLLVVVVGGCGPTMPYRAGQGSYAVSSGKVTNLGRFTVDSGGCFNYSEQKTDDNVVLPAIKQKLGEMGANAADNVVVREKWWDFLLGVLVVPALMACNHFTISGDALRIEGATSSGPTGLDGGVRLRFARDVRIVP